MDGTLIQSEAKLRMDVVHTMERLGVQIDHTKVGDDWYALAHSYGISKKDFDREFRRRKSWEQSLREGDVSLFPDVYPCLDELLRRGIQAGVLTRSSARYTRLKIDHFNLGKYVRNNVEVTPVNKENHPTKEEEALRLIKKLDLESVTNVYFIGDSPEDVLVAPRVSNRLGIKTQGIYISRNQVPIPEAVQNYPIVRSLEEIPGMILGDQNGK